jgi:CHAT domain-containing protein
MRWQDFFVQDGSLEIEASIKARRANLLHTQGRLALRMGDLASATNCFKQGQQLAATGMREAETKNRLGLAQVFLEMKDYERAKNELRACITTTASGEFPELEWQASCLAGILSRQLGDNQKAFTHFEHATKVLEAMRQSIPFRELRYAFLNCRFDPYQELVSLLFHSEKDFPRALAYVNRAKSMTLREYMEENGRRLNADRSTATSTEAVGMPDGYSTVEYFSLPDELLVFVSGPNGIQGVSIPLSPAELEQKVQKYLESIRSEDRKVFSRLSRDLYDELVAPALSVLDTHRTNGLIFVPDGPLHVLPFASLRDSSGRYLLEKYSLAYAPSQGVLRYCLSLNRGSAAQDKAVLLLDAASSLSGASDELADIASIYGGKATLVGSANLSSLDQKVQGATIIHFAGHATISLGKPKLVFGTSPMATYVDSSRVGKWLLGNTRLVWLAGCNTGIGPIAQGETSWGLVPAFLGAGAPAVVASLMPVDDAATRTLTVRFYDLLAHGSVSKAKALQQAQLSMLGNTATDANPQPLQWVPFVLVGDPR